MNDSTRPDAPDRTPTREVWRSLLPEAVLAGRGAPWLAATALDHLGDPDGERVALLGGGPVLLPRLAYGHLRLTGADRVPFVHGLVSHDVAGLAEGGAVDALLLDHRGQPQAGLAVHRRRDDLFLAVHDGQGPVVARTLGEHVIFDQVVIADLDERLASLTLCAADAAAAASVLESGWPGAGAALTAAIAETEPVSSPPTAPPQAPLAPVGVVTTAGGRALLHPRRLGPGWAVDVHLLAEDLAPSWALWIGAGARPVGERAWTAGRVAHGLASAHAEGRLGLPQETGLEDRISYRKGCYLGQEIMARVEARGRLRRGLRAVRLAGPPPGLGAASGWRLEDAAGRAIGALGSASPAPDGDGWWGLAVVRDDADTTVRWRLVVDGEPPRVGPAEVDVSLRPTAAS
jgi:tRNA-modifying protein YgfZ